jgi:hypothetical protein
MSSGLCFLQALFRGNNVGVYMANGIADILPNKPFQVRVINTSERVRKRPKGMILGHALPHPTGIITKEIAVHTESPRKKAKPQLRQMSRGSTFDKIRPQYG